MRLVIEVKDETKKAAIQLSDPVFRTLATVHGILSELPLGDRAKVLQSVVEAFSSGRGQKVAGSDD